MFTIVVGSIVVAIDFVVVVGVAIVNVDGVGNCFYYYTFLLAMSISHPSRG